MRAFINIFLNCANVKLTLRIKKLILKLVYFILIDKIIILSNISYITTINLNYINSGYNNIFFIAI